MTKKFSFDAIENFDEHIDKSIPNFGVLTQSIKSIAEYFYVEDTNVYDLGCSTGKLLKEINTNCNKIGYDIATLLPKEPGFYPVDLNSEFELQNASVVFSIFTSQFLRPDKRLQYFKTIYEGLNVGGALIICEKVYREKGKIQEIMSFSHYDHKLKEFRAEEIIAKERDLRFIMKPWEDFELQKALVDAGFYQTEFWSMFNFKGILAIKK
jgi:tRNA (cmo5U34)-methyltransferase